MPLDSEVGQSWQDDEDGKNGEDDEDSEDDGDDSSLDIPFKKTGRISNNNHTVLSHGFAQIDELFRGLEQQSKLPAQRILQLYNSHRSKNGGARAKNTWNLYQAYFQQNVDEEKGRLNDDELKGVSAVPCSRRYNMPNYSDSDPLQRWHVGTTNRATLLRQVPGGFRGKSCMADYTRPFGRA